MVVQSKIELTEICSKKIAKYVLENFEKIEFRIISDYKYEPVECFKKYLNKIIKSKDGKIKVEYSNKNDERYFSKGYSMQSMLREFRHSLYSHQCYDIDIENCHPVILSQYCKKNNIDCPRLNEYIEKRNTIFKNLKKKDLEKMDIKLELLKIMNGGKLDTEKFSVFEKLDNELKNIQKIVLSLNKDIEKEVKKKKDTEYNIEGSVVNHLLQKIENQILMSAFSYFKKNNFVITSLCFDGLTILNNKEITDEYLKTLNKHCYDETGYKVNFLIKEMDEGLKFNIDDIEDEKEEIVVETDYDCAKIILEKLGNKIVKCDGRFFIKLFDNANIYKEDESPNFRNTKEYLIKFILELDTPLKKEVDGFLIPYSENMSGAKNIYEATIGIIDDDNEFVSKMFESNIRKLCFLNGYYDFKESKFKDYDDKTFSIVYVNSNYDDNVDEKYTKILKDKIINPILYDETTQKQFLNWTARGLAGEYIDKTWTIGLGHRDSGKGVLTQLYLSTFNNYVGTFNADEMLCNRVGNGDMAKKLGWLIPFQFRRLNFSNELKSADDTGRKNKLDGNLIKSISSGGDDQKARKNYKDEISFKIQGRMCLFMNDLIETDPLNATETLHIFEFMSIFKDKITEEEIKINNDKECKTKYFLKDDEVKEILIKDENIKKAFIKLIIESYGENKCDRNADIFNDGFNVKDEIKHIFEITLNKNDKIAISDMNDYNKSYLPKMTKSKIKQTLSCLGVCESVLKDKDGKSIRYYTGLKLKPQVE